MQGLQVSERAGLVPGNPFNYRIREGDQSKRERHECATAWMIGVSQS